MKQYLDDGKILVVGVKGNTCLTYGGHVVLIYGMETRNNTEYFRIADPNKNNSNYRKRDTDKLIDNIRNDGFVLVKASYIHEKYAHVEAIWQ